MNSIRASVQKVLDKADQLLTTEPARLIGYGAAIVIFLAVQVINYVRPGLMPSVSFEQSAGFALGAISTLVILVESIRQFVFSPQTFIEQLSDEWQRGHELAHFEEELRQSLAQQAALQAESRAVAAERQSQAIAVGSAKASGTGSKSN